MITVRNLVKKYNSFEALSGIDINVKKGQIYGFIGKNGAGKSTTMNILTGLSKPTSGSVTVNGKNIKDISHPGQLDVGYLPEDPKFYPWMTAIETLSYLSGKNEKDLYDLLEWGGLKNDAKRKTGGFSRGMKQRLGICTAMIKDPPLLILDEPSSALDPQGRSDVLNLITDLRKMGKTVIFSSHILSDVERVCDTIGIIMQGKMILEKPLSVMQKENIHPVFDIETKTEINEDVLKQITNNECVLSAEKQRNMLSVHVNDTDLASVHLSGVLSGNNVTTYSFNLRKSTLEDMFIREVNSK